MEKHFNESSRIIDSEHVKINDGLTNRPPYTITTLYYSCDSNIFQSSESSVQVVSASNYNAAVGHCKPNFCELDIIAKKEKLKVNVDFMPLQTITEELKSPAMATKTKVSKDNFRKKLYQKTANEEPNEVLCLASVLKDDETPFMPTLNRSKEINVQAEKEAVAQNAEKERTHVKAEKPMVDEICQTRKKSRSKSRRRKAIKEPPEKNEPAQSVLPVFTPKFADLGTAKTMYFAELPNNSAFVPQKEETPATEHSAGADKEKQKQRRKSKTPRAQIDDHQDQNPAKADQQPDIVINKVENDFPPLSSPGSLSTVPSRSFKKQSDVSLDSIEVPRSTKTDFRKRNNTPNGTETFLDDVLRKYKTDTAVYKGKHRKKHRTSPKLSSDEDATKECTENMFSEQETEVKVIYKVDKVKPDANGLSTKEKKVKRKHNALNTKVQPENKTDKAPNKRKNKSEVKNEKKDNDKAQQLEIVDKEKKQKTEKDNPDKNAEKSNELEDSILNLYVTNKSLQSESCTMITDEDFLKTCAKERRKSRMSKSRTPSPENKSKKSGGKKEAQVLPLEDIALLENAKERKTKQKSKSRVAEDKTHKAQHKRKAPSAKETKKLSRKSASNLSQKDAENFDGLESVEGIQKARKSRKTEDSASVSRQKKDKPVVDVTNRTSLNAVDKVKAVEEKFPFKVEETPVLSVFKEKKKRSKSYAHKKENAICKEARHEHPLSTSRSYVFDGSVRSSDTHIGKRQPRLKKSKSFLLESRKDKFYEELKRISTIQQVDSSRKRFKVVSKTIRSSHISDGSTTQSTEQSIVNRKYTGSHRFKTYISSEKEKEEILNLPIFNKTVNSSAAQADSNFEKRTIEVYRKRSMKKVNQNYEISEVQQGIVKEEKSRKKKKTKKPLSRREVSFSHLNVMPLMETYRRPAKPIVRRTLLPEKRYDKGSIDMASKQRIESIHSEDTDISLVRKESLRRLNMFTIVLGEKILEICTKAIDKDGRIIEGFTVSGTEPPKRLRSHETVRDRLKLMAKVGKLRNVFLPSIEIVDGVMKMSSAYEEVVEQFERSHVYQGDTSADVGQTSAETMTDKENESNDDSSYKAVKHELMQASSKDILPIRTPVLLKTKRKFNFSVRKKSKQNFKKEVLGKVRAPSRTIQTSTESHSTSDIQERKSKSADDIKTSNNSGESLEKTTWQQKSLQKQEIKNSARMCSAVKLMESSLQIIKEESQSTDSSSKRSRVKGIKETKQSQSEIKETQTDFNVDDIDKIKEVITYLYNSLDVKKPPMQESVATFTETNAEVQSLPDIKLTKQDSGTETSSYHEQFKNFVKNVAPKFCGLKKSTKSKSDKKQASSDICISSRIPTLRRRSSTCQAETKIAKSDSVVSDSSSGGDHSSSGSDPKEARDTKERKSSKNFIRKRSSSADVLTSGYFEKYKSTKELIEQQRKRRAESEDSRTRKKTAPPIEPEFKSSTSASDFSSLILSFKDDPSPPVKNEKDDVVVKTSEEKYVQCVLVADFARTLIDKNIGTVTEDEKDNAISKDVDVMASNEKTTSISLQIKNDVVNNVKTTDSKNFMDKSLQTSIQNEPERVRANILYTDVSCKPATSKKGIIEDLIRRVSSHSFISPRRSPAKLHKEEDQQVEKRASRSLDKLSKFKRTFSNRDQYVFSYVNTEKKKSQSKKHPESDYINFIKLERHLEKLLGLYPSIFKAIRSHMDETTVRKLDQRMKVECPDVYTSCDTLATTIDTVTEYKNTDSFDKYPSFSESNLNKFNRYCDSLHLSGQEYHLQQFINSQNLISEYKTRQNNNGNNNNNNTVHFPTRKNERKPEVMANKKDINTTYPNTVSSSASLQNVKKNVWIKQSKKLFKNKGRGKKNKVKNNDTATRIFSTNEFLGSSSDESNCCKENWSVASPLYSITTPSANLSLMCRSQSSASLMVSKPTQTKVTKSKSAIEMSSEKKINRKLTLKYLLDASHVMRKDQANPNVLVVSVNSSCTVFATPSKFLAKVEKQLKKADEGRPVKIKDRSPIGYEQQENKKSVDEQSLHSIFFSDSNVHKSPSLSDRGSHKPFYIHKKSDANEEEFPDSLEVKLPNGSPTTEVSLVRGGDEEDLGNFSADSLETEGSKCKTNKLVDDIASKQNHAQIPQSQSFFVYSNTVNYDKDTSRNDKDKDGGHDNNSKKHQTESIPVDNSLTPTKPSRIIENVSNTLLSESGYESTKSRRTASIRNFFKKGGSLLDIFRNSSKNKIPKLENLESSASNLTSFSNIWQKRHEQNLQNSVKDEDGRNSRERSPYRSGNAVYWTSTKRDPSPKSERTTTFSEIAGPSTPKSDKSCSTQRTKGTHMSYRNKSCSCSDPVQSYQRQMDECHAYAEKVLLESQLRREGYYKQYQEFKEIPLELLIGKRVPNKSRYAQEVAVQTKPKSKPTSTQSRRRSRGVGVDATPPDADKYDIGIKTEEAATTATSNEDLAKSLALHSDVVVLRHESGPRKDDKKSERSKTKSRTDNDDVSSKNKFTQASRANTPRRSNFTQSDIGRTPEKANAEQSSGKTATSDFEEIPSRPSIKCRTVGNILIRSSQSLADFFAPGVNGGKMKDRSTFGHVSRKTQYQNERPESPKNTTNDKTVVTTYKTPSKPKSRSRSASKNSRGCSCDGVIVVPEPAREPSPVKVPVLPELPKPPPSLPPPSLPPPSLPPPPPPTPLPVEKSESSTSSTLSSLGLRESEPNLFFHLLLADLVDDAMNIGDHRESLKRASRLSVGLPPAAAEQIPVVVPELETREESEICRRTSEDFRKGLTDKEVFDKLLNSFEKEDEIAVRLSKDEDFFQDQIKTIKKESDESIEEEEARGDVDPNDVIYSDDPIGAKHRSTHFWEEKMKAMRAKEDNSVKEDDIGTCFSRGFRPDNIALSGDACFNLNKQDRLKFPKGMLTNEESIIDFSERETPLDYLLALGFMVDEASNALKDEDIRSRLLAAITEARVWINKITTTQGTLLYLVAYKSRPKTMRYFLQLVEAIINKRINNAIKLDGFLRVLEKVEEGEIQMINILGADKFEDEENEEKIVKKQLRQLFITVYKIAEKEAMVKGKQLSQQAIVLLRILAAKYRAGLHPHLELIARYIGQELLNTETQLEAAMIFLSRLDTAEVKLKEFEAYCDIKCEKKKKNTTPKVDTSEMEDLHGSMSSKTRHNMSSDTTNSSAIKIIAPKRKKSKT